jgi:RNA polymerase sigma-70 factor (ECF subfamily)
METSASFLERLQQQADGSAWDQLVQLYRPWIHGWLRRQGLADADADDLAQEVMLTVVREIPKFHHAGRPGAFRAWLRVITLNRLKGFWRARQERPLAGGSDLGKVLDQLEDPHSPLSRRWDMEHDQHVVHCLLSRIEPEFQASTWQAFRRVVLDDQKPADVAAELAVSLNAVLIAKSRVLRRLRQEGAGLIDE